MYEMEGALLDLPIQAGRLAWQHRLRRADRRGQPPASGPGFPVPSASPGFPLGGVRFRRGCISTPAAPPGASVRGEQLRSFSVVHRTTVVIHARAGLSTASFTAYPQVTGHFLVAQVEGGEAGGAFVGNSAVIGTLHHSHRGHGRSLQSLLVI